MKLSLVAIAIMTLSSTHAFAFDEGDFRLGAQAGNVGLMGDVGSQAGNAMGAGALLGYAATSEMMFALGYTTSSHTDLKHSDLNVGVDWYLNSYDAAYLYFSGGVDFITHELTAVSKSGSGFGVYAGLGLDFELGKRASVGLQAIYHNAFETTVTVNNTTVKAIQSYSTVMARAMFTLSSGKD